MEPAEQAEEGRDRGIRDEGAIDDVLAQAREERLRCEHPLSGGAPLVHLGNIGFCERQLEGAGRF